MNKKERYVSLATPRLVTFLEFNSNFPKSSPDIFSLEPSPPPPAPYLLRAIIPSVSLIDFFVSVSDDKSNYREIGPQHLCPNMRSLSQYSVQDKFLSSRTQALSQGFPELVISKACKKTKKTALERIQDSLDKVSEGFSSGAMVLTQGSQGFGVPASRSYGSRKDCVTRDFCVGANGNSFRYHALHPGNE